MCAGEPRNTAVTLLIRYTIPNVLSNIGYDIYAVSAPAIAADTLATDTLPLKVKFSLKYNDQDGRQVNDIKMKNPISGTYSYETVPNVVDTVLVASRLQNSYMQLRAERTSSPLHSGK